MVYLFQNTMVYHAFTMVYFHMEQVIVYLQLFDHETLLDCRIIHVRTFLPPSVHVSSINPTGCATMES